MMIKGQMDLHKHKQEIAKNGWTILWSDSEILENLMDDIVNLSSGFGMIVKSRATSNPIDWLKPTERELSNFASLSSMFGKDSLPLHCDTAHWTTPCRYVLLACPQSTKSSVSTNFLDTNLLKWSPQQRLLLQETQFRVQNGAKSFYSSVLSPQRSFTRFDPGCMRSLCDKGSEVMDFFAYDNVQHFVQPVFWELGKIVILDNWRILHGRSSCLELNEERVLLRTLIQ